MPLDRDHVTAASRTMLPTYVLLSAAFGIGYLLDPGHRLAKAPSTTFQRGFMPLWCWGTIMLLLAVLMLVAFRTHSRATFAYALSCGALTWVIWGCTVGAAIFTTDNTSWLAPIGPWFFAIAHVASLRSLQRREV